ncbi:MAG TPA: hydantoinase/oxoprolinase N-terminal domain-containing protein, partial [Rhizomicrobium sp.]|nr:hydantoinase/oxoprolinase N-terminal domain-containing protein [Rhizomicrobium sp.]
MSASGKWHFYIDRGGTFTDIVAEAPDRSLSSLKQLSESQDYDDAALEGIRRCLDIAPGSPIPAERVA